MYYISCTFNEHGQKYRINRSVSHNVLYLGSCCYVDTQMVHMNYPLDN